ncbi:hypothetical protein NEOLEDRAFT_1184878 [Neolentinus lepideus HHB14362 ss-1]|uniref:Uncharacterized protein n=1 Tax=Neolentinus lepideus HHB14362 ss-1 TaxID=1314782 RepID=A0A165KIJ7_9AGAM|nr:hypothetical protein NEOLEDRAFT_1184878 [Neolentinus lepideus HHB14362 ss-1]
MSPNDIQAPSLVRRLAIRMETEDAKNKWLAEEREKERVKKEEEEWVKKEEERRKNDIEDNEQKQHKEAEKKKKEEEEWLQWEEEERKQKVEEEERKKDEEEEERTQKEEEKERICKEAEAGLRRSISRLRGSRLLLSEKLLRRSIICCAAVLDVVRTGSKLTNGLPLVLPRLAT